MRPIGRKGPGFIAAMYSSTNGLESYTPVDFLTEIDIAAIEARVTAWARGLGKPRARWNPYGVGYWTVRLVRDGTIYQGVGVTLTEAYGAWVNIMEQHA